MDHILWRSNLANKAFTSNAAYEKDAEKHHMTKTDAFWHSITLVIPDDACKLAIGQRYASQQTQTGLTFTQVSTKTLQKQMTTPEQC